MPRFQYALPMLHSYDTGLHLLADCSYEHLLYGTMPADLSHGCERGKLKSGAIAMLCRMLRLRRRGCSGIRQP